MKNIILLVTLALLNLPLITNAHAASRHPAPSPTPDGTDDGEDADVSQVKQKYWARGDKSELGVVQNRLYTKEGKFEFGVFGGIISTDPFLSVHNAGAMIGYHFSEYFAVDALAWKSFVANSDALNTLQNTVHDTANTDNPQGFYGGELAASLLYGKLSLLGSSIIYYDLHFLAGGGITTTETGNYATPIVGLGQQVYLNQTVSIRLDYRFMPYYDAIPDKADAGELGTIVGHQWSLSDVVTFGVSFLF